MIVTDAATVAAACGSGQLAAFARHGFGLADVELDEIETAGGSLRCCVAETF